MNKEKMIIELMENLAFKYEDSKELVNIILNNEKEVKDIVNLYCMKGARWTESEIISYINAGWDEKMTIEEVLEMDCFYKLSSGLIVSWDY